MTVRDNLHPYLVVRTRTHDDTQRANNMLSFPQLDTPSQST